jgi:O-antigen/teichoic acid export membrane protein
MARIIGPQKLGYFNYVMWLANMSGIVGSVGVPMTTRKYMAEYLGRGEPGVARAVFFATMQLQVLIASAITAIALAIVFVFGDPHHRLVSAFQVASILPAMLVFVPSQANVAREDMRANVASSIVGGILWLAGIMLSLLMGWGLLGIAVGILISRTTEFVLRFIPVLRWVRRLPDGVLPSSLKHRMVSFSGQSMVLMLLNVVVWDRSDMIFLKFMSKDISQITFFSVAFNLVEKAMVFPQAFGQAIGASVMAQYGRDKSRLSSMLSTSARYMLLLSLPLLVGLATLSSPVIRVIYGRQYIPAIPVLAAAASLAVLKPLLLPAQQFLQATEQQMFLIWWSLGCGVVNVVLDLLLIPRLGAFGAAIANGSAQGLAVIGIWARAASNSDLRLDYRGLAKTFSAGAALCIAVVTMTFKIESPGKSLLIGTFVGAVVFFGVVRYSRVLQNEDRNRLAEIRSRAPTLLDSPLRFLGDLLIPAAEEVSTVSMPSISANSVEILNRRSKSVIESKEQL